MSHRGRQLMIERLAIRSWWGWAPTCCTCSWFVICLSIDACVGRLSNFIWMGMRQLESPERQRRVTTFLIGDSFLRSWNVHREMAGDTFAQRRHLKWLSRKVVIVLMLCRGFACPSCWYFISKPRDRIQAENGGTSKASLQEPDLITALLGSVDFYPWMQQGRQESEYRNHVAVCPCRIPPRAPGGHLTYCTCGGPQGGPPGGSSFWPSSWDRWTSPSSGLAFMLLEHSVS